ncbi:carboxypeptidase-like regulatory domain-containing protein [Flavihumibacter sp. CACIAM 22H1]|uniref:TonB-dependent receptor n=1 Tax=Flavihumibacter sp. CACIAM 22H1 TaxID=1812911 RepID=UPI0007A809B7|nr:carboxypeptidase-like regulatory domain-containing protein [Flavihumibacter sp. CACIAM 22H1]KYP14721.1 MAG: TonB-dependent receptor [Flavihumibacter sp. CACIAM 22H1]
MKTVKRFLLVFLLLQVKQFAFAQAKSALLTGKIIDQDDKPLAAVSITIVGRQQVYHSNDSGYFELTLPANRALGILFSYTGFQTVQRNFLLNNNEKEYVVIRMAAGSGELAEVTVTDNRIRRESGLITINPKQAINIPAPGGGIESLIKVFVGSNNELTSNYSVRGGSYDENLIYVNDFEIFRPYLVRSGQQEGLSFINPELTRTVQFYNGGFQARYGDKLSSVLDIQYKKPKKAGGSAYIGLLEQGLHLEGTSKNQRFSYLVGARNRSNRNLLSSQETKGNYVPSSADIQGLFNWQFSEKWSAEFFGNLSRTKFTLRPEFSQPSSTVFSPFFTSNIGLDIYFDGAEKDQYGTSMAGLSVTKQVRKNLRIKWLASYFQNKEEESIDISGAYLFGERSFDRSKPEFGLIVNPLGAGVFQQYARNNLKIGLFNLSHKGYYDKGRHYHQWGVSVDRQQINDRLREFEYQDSAGYSLPNNPGTLQLFKALRSNAAITIHRFSGYWQDNISLGDSSGTVLQVGIRVNYNDLNQELLFSPRAGISWKPNKWKKDIIFRGSAGLYAQPPFYRELRRYDGSLNPALKAQKSWQASAGFDYNFPAFNRILRLSTEAYFKQLWDVVPYDIDNVRMRYFGENNAKAYATGLEARLYGELVKDAESYLSIGFMRTREDIKDDFYYQYTLNEQNQPVDSALTQNGFLRRPTDRFLTIGMFFQDYLSTNKNIKVYINGIYGSNLPYNIPNSVRYRNALFIDPYVRVDLGFSALLLNSDRTRRRRHAPFRSFENIWASLEVFNIIDRANTISYLLIKDFSNTTYAIPNRLTPRLLNVKLVGRW